MPRAPTVAQQASSGAILRLLGVSAHALFAGQSGGDVLCGRCSLTRIEPVSPLAACARERAPSRSLATRDAACEDIPTLLPTSCFGSPRPCAAKAYDRRVAP